MYYSPARVPEAVTVGASTFSDSRAWFSNKGYLVDIYAPGVFIKSASNLDVDVCPQFIFSFM
jgi:subtilisin family serine protease